MNDFMNLLQALLAGKVSSENQNPNALLDDPYAAPQRMNAPVPRDPVGAMLSFPGTMFDELQYKARLAQWQYLEEERKKRLAAAQAQTMGQGVFLPPTMDFGVATPRYYTEPSGRVVIRPGVREDQVYRDRKKK